jgi:hypothetical protein
MALLDILRKLGILRYGAEAGVYTNAAERPTSLQMDDVFDPEKDLVTREALQRLKPPSR